MPVELNFQLVGNNVGCIEPFCPEQPEENSTHKKPKAFEIQCDPTLTPVRIGRKTYCVDGPIPQLTDPQ